MPRLQEYVDQLVRECYRQGYDDCLKRFDCNPLVADYKAMRETQEAQVALIRHKMLRDLGGNPS